MKETIEEFDWTNDWIEFVDSVACIYQPGMTEDTLTKKYVGNQISWGGEIEDIKLDTDIYPHLGIGMPLHETKLSSCRVLRARRLVIPVREDQVDLWASCSIGMKLNFRATIGFNEFGQPGLGVYLPSGEGAGNLDAQLEIAVLEANRVPDL